MKYLRRYAVVALLLSGVTVVSSGIIAADESAKRISLGQVQEVVVYGENAKIYHPASVTDIEDIIDWIMNRK